MLSCFNIVACGLRAVSRDSFVKWKENLGVEHFQSLYNTFYNIYCKIETMRFNINDLLEEYVLTHADKSTIDYLQKNPKASVAVFEYEITARVAQYDYQRRMYVFRDVHLHVFSSFVDPEAVVYEYYPQIEELGEMVEVVDVEAVRGWAVNPFHNRFEEL